VNVLRLLYLCLIMVIPTVPFPGRRPYAADPVTARVISPPVESLDPVSLPRADSAARDVAENLFVGLTRYDPASGQIQPALARDWTVSDDGLTWTFNLRDDVKWVAFNSSSQQVEAVRPVVAGDFVYGIRRACDPQSPNPATHSVYIIDGCRRVAAANPQFTDDISIARELAVQALNDHKLQVRLLFPAPYFVSLLALPEFRPVPREAIARDPDWTQTGVILTDGPWAMADWIRSQQITLVRNPLWPDPIAGNVQRVVITFAPSAEAVAQMFTGGSADFARLGTSIIQSIRQAAPDDLLLAPNRTITVLGFSVERPVVQVEAFRRALSQAVDRDKLVGQLLPGAALPMSRFTPPGAIGGPNEQPDNRGFSPDNARAALAVSGVPNCRLTEKLTLLVEDRPEMTALAQALVDQWQATLGCNPVAFTIRPAPVAYVQAVAHAAISTTDQRDPPRPQMWLVSWSADYSDANAWTGDALHCQYGFLRTGAPCSDAERLIDKAALETDPAKRAEDYNKAEAIWFGEHGTFPVAPLFVTYNAVAQQPWLKGATANGSARFDLWTISR
jgi:oligopeptide transport system substrate-binding protein